MAEQLLHRLQASLEFLSGVEQKIASLILLDPKAFTALSMTEAASLAAVSQGSITNFAKKFTGGGFPTLKLQIAAGLAEYVKQPFSVVEREDHPKDVLNKCMEESRIAFQNTTQLNTNETLERVADRILQAKKVEIYGIYRSAVAATDLYYQLLELGIPSAFVSDTLTCSVSASMLEETDVVIAISSSGQTKEVLDAARIAKQRGAMVLCLTANPTSPLAALADDVLLAAPSGHSVSGSSSEILLSQLLVTHALCTYLTSRVDEDGEKRYFGLRDILNSHSVNDF